jgi:hypothetical protein
MVTVDETNRVKGSDPASSAPAGCWPTEGRRGPVERPAAQQQRWLGSQLVVFTGSMSYIYVEGMITMRIQPYPGDIKPRNRDDTTSGIWRVWRGVYHPICSFKGETGELYLSTQGIPRLDKRTPLMSVDSSGLILMFDQEPKGLGEKVKRWPPIQIFHDAVSGCLWVELGCSFFNGRLGLWAMAGVFTLFLNSYLAYTWHDDVDNPDWLIFLGWCDARKQHRIKSCLKWVGSNLPASAIMTPKQVCTLQLPPGNNSWNSFESHIILVG